MELEQRQKVLQQAQAVFDAATERSLECALRVNASELAIRRGGIQSGDPIIAQLGRDLFQAATDLFDARRTRDAALVAYEHTRQVADHGSVRTFEEHLGDVRIGNRSLYDRYQRELEYANDAADHEAKLKWSYVLMKTRGTILAWKPAPHETARAAADETAPEVTAWR